MKDWKDYLSNEVYIRLCDCRTIRSDIPQLVNAKWKSYQESGKADKGFTKEDCLIAILELLESNSCYFDLTEDEYKEICQ